MMKRTVKISHDELMTKKIPMTKGCLFGTYVYSMYIQCYM